SADRWIPAFAGTLTLLAQLISGRTGSRATRRFLLCGQLCLRFGRPRLSRGALGRGAARRLCSAIGRGSGAAAGRAAALALRLLRREQRDRGIEREIVRVGAFR